MPKVAPAPKSLLGTSTWNRLSKKNTKTKQQKKIRLNIYIHYIYTLYIYIYKQYNTIHTIYMHITKRILSKAYFLKIPNLKTIAFMSIYTIHIAYSKYSNRIYTNMINYVWSAITTTTRTTRTKTTHHSEPWAS